MYNIKLMIVLCLVIMVAGRKGFQKQILKEIKVVQNQVEEVSKVVANLTEEALDYNDQLSSLASSCSQISGIAEDVAEILEKTEMCKKENEPRSCLKLLTQGRTQSGVYDIYLNKGMTPIKVYCDQTTEGGGWIVFQKRQDGSEDFFRNWMDYKLGFGDPCGEYWLGLEKLHLLTARSNYELRIDLGDFDGNMKYAKYKNFSIGPMDGYYVLYAEGYYGTAGDSLAYNIGYPFSTKDRDHDSWPNSCANKYKGAWWYRTCHHSNLNGLYLNGNHASFADGVNWREWTGFHYSLRLSEMKFRESN